MEYKTWLEQALCGDDGGVETDDKCLLNALVTRMNLEIDGVIRTHGLNVVGKAVWHIYGVSGGYMWDVLAPELGELRFEFMESVKTLYSDGFLPHCVDWSRGGDRSPLHSACYMLWDMDGIECPAINGDPGMLEASLDVLQFALNLDSPACQESALHGLGHLVSRHKREIRPIIDHYLQTKRPVAALRDYAGDARAGCIM